MKQNEQFKLMMRGGLGQFTQYELWTVLSCQDELGINTLMVQKDHYGQFLCKVDELTVMSYKKEEGQI
jgi:hypothetical protein